MNLHPSEALSSPVGDVPGRVVEPLVDLPPLELFRSAVAVATPALVYDLDGIKASIARIQEDFTVLEDVRLNLAIKACHTPALLSRLASLGLGADVASTGELELAVSAGFDEISATGPSFSNAPAFEALAREGVILDVDSIDQLVEYGKWRPGGSVGLRIRIPLPESAQNSATFGEESRFGVTATDPEMIEVLESTNLRVRRLHVHSGQMTPASLVYKTRYLLAIAEAFPEIDLIDFGGGFFHLYIDRPRAQSALRKVSQLTTQWRDRTGRSMALRFEPGGALLAPYGHLFTTVLSNEDHHPGLGVRVVTVDASAWNLTPWHEGQVLLADPDIDRVRDLPGRLAGNTLYENDFFGTNVLGRPTTYTFPACARGDRLVITACGAYTITNSRHFNRLDLPREYFFDSTEGLRYAR